MGVAHAFEYYQLSAKSKFGQIPWKGQYVYGIFSVSWYKFWLGRKEKGKSNRPGLTYVSTYVQVHTTNVNSWKAKTLDSSHFFLKGPCDVGIEWSIDRLKRFDGKQNSSRNLPN